jgi:hypothetical protein
VDPAAPKPDAPAPEIPIDVQERHLSFGVKAAKDDGNPMKAMLGRMGAGGPAPAAEPPMHFGTKVVVTIRGLAQLDRTALCQRVAGILDLAVDSGADGPEGTGAPVVRFLVDDPEALRTLAYQDGMAKARARAGKLAALGERSLGQVVSIQEGGAGAIDIAAQQKAALSTIYGSGGSDPLPGMEIVAEVELRVEYDFAGDHALAPGGPAISNEGVPEAIEKLAKLKGTGAIDEFEFRDAKKALIEGRARLSIAEQIQKLQALKGSGAIDEFEFRDAKKRLLSGK